jgi:hypothetical protein
MMKSSALLLAVALVVGCAGAPPPTWQKPAADTTCGDWLNEMNDDHRVDMTGAVFRSTLVDMGADPEQISEAVNDELVPLLLDRLTHACRSEAEVAALPGVMRRVIIAERQGIFDAMEDAVSP